jgi:multicomponent Na+:H+ antiporter subunit D
MLLPICFTTILAVVLGIVPEIAPNFYDMASQAADSICKGWTGGGW